MARLQEPQPSLTSRLSSRDCHLFRLILLSAVFLVLVFGAQNSWATTRDPKVKKSIIRTAQELLGTPYRSGGDSPDEGFDCSGFVSFVLAKNGIDLGRSSPEQFKKGKKITRRDLNPGDLVFFTSTHKRKRVAHVGIYLGNGEFIHAASNNRRIQVNELTEDYWARHYYGARRF